MSNNCMRNNLTTYFRHAFSIAQIYTDPPYCLALHASVSLSVYIHVPGKFLKRCDIKPLGVRPIGQNKELKDYCTKLMTSELQKEQRTVNKY